MDMSSISVARASTDTQWHEVAALADLDPDFPLGVEVAGQQIGLYIDGDKVHALEDVCPHAFALLSQGFRENGIIECPLHAAQFEVASGKCLNEIGGRDLRCFPTRVLNGRVAIQLHPVAA
jgi:nitrite reductase/ring-hydroxylating ferredoxin subunit